MARALLARIDRKHIIFLLVVIFAMRSLVMVVPVDLAVVAALDIATYVDGRSPSGPWRRCPG